MEIIIFLAPAWAGRLALPRDLIHTDSVVIHKVGKSMPLQAAPNPWQDKELQIL